jgi:hypothetical protein
MDLTTMIYIAVFLASLKLCGFQFFSDECVRCKLLITKSNEYVWKAIVSGHEEEVNEQKPTKQRNLDDLLVQLEDEVNAAEKNTNI